VCINREQRGRNKYASVEENLLHDSVFKIMSLIMPKYLAGEKDMKKWAWLVLSQL
jgi:hypothetical protein